MCAGKTLNGSKAKKLGLVDSVADPFALEHAAVQVRGLGFGVWGLGFWVLGLGLRDVSMLYFENLHKHFLSHFCRFIFSQTRAPSPPTRAPSQAAQGLADGTLKVNREPQGMKKWMRLAMVMMMMMMMMMMMIMTATMMIVMIVSVVASMNLTRASGSIQAL